MSLQDEEGAILFTLTHDSFGEIAICHRFIRNVVILVAAQILAIAGVALVAILVDDVHDFLTAEKYFNVFLGAVIAAVVTYIIGALLIFRDPDLSKRFPANVIVFSTVTVSLAVMAAIGCTTFKFQALIMALGVVFLSLLGIFIFLLNTKISIITWQGFAFCILWSLLCCSALVPLPYSTIENKVLAGSIAMVFVLILTFDILRIIQLAPQTELSPEDHVVGAFELHSDFIWSTVVFPIFFILLCLVCICTEDKNSESERPRRNVRNAPQRAGSRNRSEVRVARSRRVRHDRLTAAILERLSDGEPGSV